MAIFNRITLDIPEEWVDSSSIELMEPPDTTRMPATITLTHTLLDREVTPDFLKTAMEEGVAETFPECTVHASEVVQINGVPAYVLDYSWPVEDGPEYRRLQATLVNGRDSLVLTCTGVAERYDEYGPLFRRAAASLQVRPAGKRSE